MADGLVCFEWQGRLLYWDGEDLESNLFFWQKPRPIIPTTDPLIRQPTRPTLGGTGIQVGRKRKAEIDTAIRTTPPPPQQVENSCV